MVKSPSESRRSGRLARMVVFAAAAAMSMTVVSQARADVTDQLLDQLRAKGVLTRGEYSKLKSRHAAEKADMARPYGRHYSKDGVVVVPDDRYLTASTRASASTSPASSPRKVKSARSM